MSTVSERRDRVDHALTAIDMMEPSSDALAEVESLVRNLLTDLEAAEEQLEHAMPAKVLEPVGVWQIELANGTVHNFVASRCVGGGSMIFYGITAGLLEFVIDLPPGRSPIVLVVRPELVVSYQRLGDLGREDGQVQPATFTTAPFAGPVQKPAPSPSAGGDWLKMTTKP